MEAWLFYLHNGVPYVHPLWLALGIFIGSWLPSVTRIITNGCRTANNILRRF